MVYAVTYRLWGNEYAYFVRIVIKEGSLTLSSYVLA